MNKTEIDNWFIIRLKEFLLSKHSSFIKLTDEYNVKFVSNRIPNERTFNPLIFSVLFTKVRTIGFSSKTFSNDDFIQYRQLLIIELNYYSRAIAMDFANVLSNRNIQFYQKEIYNYIYIIFSHFVEIYNNLHQYRDATIKTNIKIAESYLNEVFKIITEEDMKKSLQNIFDFLKLVYDDYKDQLRLR